MSRSHGPANHWRNDVVALVTTKGLMPYGGAIGADPYLDRAGIQCRTVKDAALVLDALKDPKRGYFDPRDIYTALPRGLVSEKPYASFASVAGPKPGKPLAGMRIGIVREYMVKHAENDAAMSDQVNGEIARVLRATSANVGIPEITVPAGFNAINYEPDYVLNAAKNAYVSAANESRRSTLAIPLPVGIAFWGGPGDEGIVIKAAAAYETATKHRAAPKAFGPVPHTSGTRLLPSAASPTSSTGSGRASLRASSWCRCSPLRSTGKISPSRTRKLSPRPRSTARGRASGFHGGSPSPSGPRRSSAPATA